MARVQEGVDRQLRIDGGVNLEINAHGVAPAARDFRLVERAVNAEVIALFQRKVPWLRWKNGT